MFNQIKLLMDSSNKDLRKRIYFTLIILAIFCFGTTISVPWAKDFAVSELGFLGIFNLMSGGALQQFSIFALGVGPYITASIITQLLQMDIIPYFKDLKDQGYVGKQKINKITRYLGIVFAFAQAFIVAISFNQSATTADIVTTSLVMTAGTALVLWLGDLITKKGIGNGISLIILAGILQTMPSMFIIAFNSLVNSTVFGAGLGTILFVAFVIIYLLIVVGIIWIQLAERRIPIQHANRTSSSYGGQQNFLPIKINSAGVIPVIFASTFVAIPSTIVAVIGNETAINFVENYISYTSLTGFFLYIALIFFFGYFYTFLQMNPEEMSKNLNKSGAYIPGVRPGVDTSKYISIVLKNLTIVGSVFLIIIAGLPILFSNLSGLPAEVTIGGTGLLIVVGVAIETSKQIESSLVTRTHRSRVKR